MKLIGLMPARNESWVIGLSLRAALRWCDEVVCLDHASADATGAIMREVAAETGRVEVLTDPDPTWKEMAHRQRLLEAARDRGATHIAIVDADEVLTGNLLEMMRIHVEQMQPGAILQIPMRNMWRSPDRYRRDSSVWGSAITSVAFGSRNDLYWQSADGYDFHHREPYGGRVRARYYPQAFDGGVMHLQFASWRRLVAKHALYKVTETIRWPGRKPASEIDRMYSQAIDEGGLVVNDAPASWWLPYVDIMHHMNVDAEPWQETECRRLVAEHGIEKFKGLDLFGVC